MKAVFVTGGKQYTANVGDVLFIEKLNAEAEETVVFDQVLFVGEGADEKLNKIIFEQIEVIKNGKGKKINIITYKPKKGSARRMGHRQPYTKVEITNIVG